MRKAKYILMIIFLLFIISKNTNIASASQCRIDSTPSYILDYIKDTRKIISNMQNTAIKKKDKEEKSIIWEENTRSFNKLYWVYNSMFSWWSYNLNFEYYMWGIKKEIPKQIKRDIAILERESDNISKKFRDFTRKWISDIELTKEEICKDIKDSSSRCWGLNNSDSIEILKKLLKSTDSLIWYMKNNAVDKDYYQEETYFLLWEETLLNIKIDYSKTSIEECNKSDWEEKWFFKTIRERIEQISITWKNNEKSMQEWRDAINLLWWDASDEEYRKLEAKLLASELAKQWISWDRAKTIMWNLEAYNKNWSLLWWEEWFFNSLKKQADELDQVVKELEKKVDRSLDTYISVKDFDSKTLIIKKTEDIKISINSIYAILKEASLENDETVWNLKGQMEKMHINLSQWINSLVDTCQISVKVCESQKKWLTPCWKCN